MEGNVLFFNLVSTLLSVSLSTSSISTVLYENIKFLHPKLLKSNIYTVSSQIYASQTNSGLDLSYSN